MFVESELRTWPRFFCHVKWWLGTHLLIQDVKQSRGIQNAFLSVKKKHVQQTKKPAFDCYDTSPCSEARQVLCWPEAFHKAFATNFAFKSMADSISRCQPVAQLSYFFGFKMVFRIMHIRNSASEWFLELLFIYP